MPLYQVLYTDLHETGLPLQLECPDLTSALEAYRHCASCPTFTYGTLELYQRLANNHWARRAGEVRVPGLPSRPLDDQLPTDLLVAPPSRQQSEVPEPQRLTLSASR